MVRSNAQFQSDFNRNYNDAVRKKTERYEQERQRREKAERQQRAEAEEGRAREQRKKEERREREWQTEQRRRAEVKKQRQRSQRQAEKTASVSNKPAEAYCSRNSKDYFFCYGPVQLLQAGEKSLDSALSYAGCKDPSNTQQNNYMGRGKQNGAWFICLGRQLESYDNSPDKIRRWLSK